MQERETKEVRIMIAGGGTGGHLYPALGIAKALREINPSTSICFVGSEFGIEASVLPQSGEQFHPLAIRGIQRGLSLRALGRNLLFPTRLIASYSRSRALVSMFDPHVVVGTGGYASGLPVKVAQSRNIPTLLQEQNSYPGLTTRQLAPKAAQVCLTYEEAANYLNTDNWTVTGNPVPFTMDAINRAGGRKALGLPSDGLVIFILGGSQGSKPLNDHFINAWQLYAQKHGAHLLWQTGSKQIDQVKETIGDSTSVTAQPFIKDMPSAYAAADLVICRAGAMTLSELALMGKPSILVPLPSAAADHQTHNARSMSDKGAALLVPQIEMQSGLLETTVEELLGDPTKLLNMSAKAEAMAFPDAGKTVATAILELAAA